jgi:hypothetical protein
MLGVPKKSSRRSKASRFLLSQKTAPLLPAAYFGVLTAFGGENGELSYLHNLFSPPSGMRTNRSSVHFAVQSLTPYGNLLLMKLPFQK